MTDMTPIERLVHDELTRAGAGNESLAITRAWRAMSLRCLSEVLAGTDEHHLGVLAETTKAAELYGYTLLNLSLANDGRSICFAGNGIVDVMQYFRWCHTFFDQLAITAADLPEPFYATTRSMESVASSNAALLARLLGQLRDDSEKIRESESRARAVGRTDAMGTVSISLDTFRGLGKALASVAGGWMVPEQRRCFTASIAAGCAELTELHELVRSHVNESCARSDSTASAGDTGHVPFAAQN